MRTVGSGKQSCGLALAVNTEGVGAVLESEHRMSSGSGVLCEEGKEMVFASIVLGAARVA